MKLSPEKLLNNIRSIRDNLTVSARNTGERIARSPNTLPVVLTSAATAFALFVVAPVSEALMKSSRAQAYAENQEWSKKQAEAALKKQEDLRNDYIATAGVVMNRVPGTNTFMFTITRESAGLAGSKGEIFDRVIAKVSKETGCPNIITSVAWRDDSFRFPGFASEPTIYSATAGCQK